VSLPVAILAGGLGRRLSPLTERIPKALIQVAGKPFILHQLELLKQHGLTKVVVCLGYLGEQVVAALGDSRRWGVDLQFVHDGPGPRGTGGAILGALHLLGERFFVLYGDTYLECDYLAVEQMFRSSEKLGLMTVLCNSNQWDRSNVLLSKGRIVRYDKQSPTPDMHHIDYGLGAFCARAFEGYPREGPFDLATVYRDLIARDQLAGFEVITRFYEIGTPGGLKDTEEYLSRRGAAKRDVHPAIPR
jgi:NDP-sugar pyrophosphorylase family protein